MFEILIGILFYVLIATILFINCVLNDLNIKYEKFSHMTETHHEMYLFFCSIWLFLVILILYGNIKDWYVKYIRGNFSRSGGGGV
jgi:uncharacterized membrane protein